MSRDSLIIGILWIGGTALAAVVALVWVAVLSIREKKKKGSR